MSCWFPAGQQQYILCYFDFEPEIEMCRLATLLIAAFPVRSLLGALFPGRESALSLGSGISRT